MACTCIADVNKDLAEHNGQIVCTMFGTSKAIVSTYKLDEKRRGKPPIMVASYCPFCGERYALDGPEKPAPSSPDHPRTAMPLVKP